jgi:hypothetical protein
MSSAHPKSRATVLQRIGARHITHYERPASRGWQHDSMISYPFEQYVILNVVRVPIHPNQDPARRHIRDTRGDQWDMS